jgi:hypothetical protein
MIPARFPFLALLALAVLPAARLYAQPAPEPIGRFVVDARGSFARYPERPDIAELEEVPVGALPSRGLGFTVGAHLYFWRWRAITFGVGGEMHFSRGRREPDVPEPDPTTPPTTPAEPLPPPFRTRFRALSSQLSFNFGKSDGWSYISGGLGTAAPTVAAERGTAGPSRPDAPGRKTLNYGGGARWFTSDHLAFSLDLRIYAMNPTAATATEPGSPRMNLLVINAGVSFK